ncbi:hypothetical protein ACS0TY_031169 [Phlomoides rotata]
MAEEFEGGVCGGNWAWNSSRNLFSSSPCSLASFGWPNHDVSDDSAGSTSDGSGSVVIQKPSPDGFGMMGISLLSSSAQEGTDWNQDLMNDSGRSEHNYSNFVMNSNMNYEQISSSLINTTTTCFPISSSTDTFPLNSASYNYTSSLLQTLFDTDSQPQQSLLDYQVNSNGFLPNFPKPSPMPNNHLPNAPLWNPDLSNGTPSTNFPQSHHFLPSTSLDNNKRPNHPSFGAKDQHEEGKVSGTVTKKGSKEAAQFKRPRIETPSPLPTFKVRKEKLGDRITALQQLVSPFGKTDTASVLHEAIEYIKFLHDQVNALSTPYLKYGSPPIQRQQGGEGLIKDLNSRGLCLVPISSTFPVAAETPSDFWTPTFGGNLK